MSSKYSVDIDPSANTSHAIMLRLVGGSKRVLDLGCAEGDLARALAAQGCTVSGVEYDAEAAEGAEPDLERLVVGDLQQLDLVAEFGRGAFDVLVFGDVLEHLTDPLAALGQARDLLAPGGFVVISIPNVAHAAVRLSLLLGRWEYRPLGLLDETHVRFFTRSALYRLLDQAGLAPLQLERTVAGPFETELGLDPAEVDPQLVEQVLADPDATTYQFVLTAVPDDAERRVAAVSEVAERVPALEAELERQRLAAQAARAELDRLQVALQQQSASTQAALSAQQETERALGAVLSSTAWRVSAPVRALGPLRAALQGPVEARRSLRRPGGLAAAGRLLRQQGLRATLARVRQEVTAPVTRQDYQAWVQAHDTLSASDRAAIARHVARELVDGPVVSVVVPVHDTEPALLRQAVESVRAQLYPRWQLRLADDASSRADTLALLQELAGDPRVQVVRLPQNAGIAGATNAALAQADGELVAFMDHDDVLPAHALYLMALEAVRHPQAQLFYSDEDKLDQHGRRYDPHFKPDLDRELVLGQNYLSHLTVVRRTLVEQLGGLRTDLDGSQDHDLVLRALEQLTDEQVRHVPHVLYHWRQFAGSGTFSSARLEEATASSRRAVTEHLARRGEVGAEVVPAPAAPVWNRVLRPLPEAAPGVTVVVPTRDRLALLRGCVDGLLHSTDYPDLHVLVVDNDSSEPETLAYLERVAQDPRVRVLRVPGPFNYSAINNTAIASVTTDAVLLLNNDIVVRHEDWLREMVSRLLVPGTGAVGAKLLYGDGRVQHAGVITGIGGVAGHSHKYAPGDSTGYFGRLALAQGVSAVTGACLLTWTSLYREVGGLDADHLAVAFNDIDLCLRIGEAGHRVVFTPYAVLDHLESASRGAEVRPEQVRRFNAEAAWMQARWGDRLDHDPAYNPNLTLVTEDFALASPPRADRPWLGV